MAVKFWFECIHAYCTKVLIASSWRKRETDELQALTAEFRKPPSLPVAVIRVKYCKKKKSLILMRMLSNKETNINGLTKWKPWQDVLFAIDKKIKKGSVSLERTSVRPLTLDMMLSYDWVVHLSVNIDKAYMRLPLITS